MAWIKVTEIRLKNRIGLNGEATSPIRTESTSYIPSDLIYKVTDTLNKAPHKTEVFIHYPNGGYDVIRVKETATEVLCLLEGNSEAESQQTSLPQSFANVLVHLPYRKVVGYYNDEVGKWFYVDPKGSEGVFEEIDEPIQGWEKIN